MIREIIQAFVKRIEKHNWIDDKTKKGILDKVNDTSMLYAAKILSLSTGFSVVYFSNYHSHI